MNHIRPAITEESVTKTLADCAACPVLRLCDAHVTNGEWHHARGVRPCAPVIDAEIQNQYLKGRDLV
jgi:hypothetical protein